LSNTRWISRAGSTLAPISRRKATKSCARVDTGAVTLIQRFGSVANLNIHLHCLVLDGVCLNRDGVAPASPSDPFPRCAGAQREVVQ
jgi:hypothetical protein